MAITIELTKKPTFKEPKWSVAEAKPGDKVTLKVTAADLLPDQSVRFEIRNAADEVVALLKADGSFQKEWVAPNPPEAVKYHFFALLCEKPSAKNGHKAVAQRLKSAELEVKGAKLSKVTCDACFVPKQEKLELKYKLEGTAPAKGRIEIWGERYPTKKPLYTEDFAPAVGEKEWKTWDGKSNDGKTYLNKETANAYLTPEFSPYRIRIVVGPNDDAVKEPLGKGVGKVATIEIPFEIVFLSVHPRLQNNLTEAAAVDKYKLASVLAVEPRIASGKYGVMGRLPYKTEKKINAGWAPGAAEAPERPGVGRIRIPCVRHTVIGESLNQGYSNAGDPALGGAWEHRVADNYMGANTNPPDGPGGAGQTKHVIDKTIYSRPELPIEIEPRLKSRDSEKNKKFKFGLFEKEAVGPVIFDLEAKDVPVDRLYRQNVGDVDPHRVFFSRSATSIKRGTHKLPQKDGSNHAVIGYWLARFKVTTDSNDEREFDVSTFDPDFTYDHTKDELIVYRNRARLSLATTDEEYDKHQKDYKRVDNKKIKIRKRLVSKDDVIWIVRNDTGATGTDKVSTWINYPPGFNSPVHYGGVRGEPPTADMVGNLRKNFSGAGGGSEPIIGKANADFPYREYVELDPDKIATVAQRERVESQAITKNGDQKGLAGVVFSPSTIAGDTYRLEATLDGCPYLRTFGEVSDRRSEAAVQGETGTMSVWRRMTISSSRRLPAKGTNGLKPAVGSSDSALAGRTHPGDGAGMNTSLFNTIMNDSFNEWEVPVPAAPDAPGEPHLNIPPNDYMDAHNTHVLPAAANFNMTNADQITEYFVTWPYLLMNVPPNTNMTWPNAVSNAVIAAYNADGTACTPDWVRQDVEAAIAGKSPLDPDDPLDPYFGGTALTASAVTPDQFKNWVKGVVRQFAHALMDEITPQINPPDSMQVIRWQEYYPDIWCDGSAGACEAVGTAGFCRGSGQALFFTVGGNPDTYEHEMTHSLHLVHFSTGSKTNSGWKHHDHGYQSCKQGYYNQAYTVPLPTGAVGPAININTGARNLYCGKCALKLRGWNEELLPCNWSHPDVF